LPVAYDHIEVTYFPDLSPKDFTCGRCPRAVDSGVAV